MSAVQAVPNTQQLSVALAFRAVAAAISGPAPRKRPLPIPEGADKRVKPRRLVRRSSTPEVPLPPALTLTTDPEVAAQGCEPEANDPDWAFPYGAHWQVAGNPTNCLRIYRTPMFASIFRDREKLNRMGELVTDELFVLWLDLHYFAFNIDCSTWTDHTRGAYLERWLRGDRLDWGKNGPCPQPISPGMEPGEVWS